MTNPLKGEAELRLSDGRSFTLVMDFDALVAAERIYNKPVEVTLADAVAGFTGALHALLLAGLGRHHPAATSEQARDILLSERPAVIDGLTKAIAASMPEKREGDNRGNRQARRAGKRSGGSGAKPG